MDDVNYLRQHAAEESFLFVVDSSRRDTSVYPEPNEYEFHFNAPFRNVIGMDLVDATVPRTAPLVDDKHTSIECTVGGVRRSATIPPGDYGLSDLAEALTTALQPHVTVAPTSSPPEVLNTLTFTSRQPFTIHSAASSIGRIVGMGLADLHSAPQEGGLGTGTVVTGPQPTNNLSDGVVRTAFAAPASGSFTTSRVYVLAGNGDTLDVAVVSDAGELVAEASQTFEEGPDFVVCTNCANPISTFVAGEQYYANFTLEPRAPVQDGTTYHMVFGGTARVYLSGPDVSRAVGAPDGPWWNYAQWTAGLDDVAADIDMVQTAHRVTCPGLAVLTGEPYVLVRCPEIEQQLYRDRAFETVHAGMGMVKLGIYGFREQRFDFVSFPPRRLPTPIGKLHKLTIRLEKPDGTLYDTKGVNHYLVMVLRYLQLNKTPEPGKSILNPHYIPNPLQYLQQQNRRPM